MTGINDHVAPVQVNADQFGRVVELLEHLPQIADGIGKLVTALTPLIAMAGQFEKSTAPAQNSQQASDASG